MTPTELRAARLRLGMTRIQLARTLKLKEGYRTIRRMEAGEITISGPVEVAIGLLLANQARDQRSNAGEPL